MAGRVGAARRNAIADRLGVNRSTVGEAIRVLEQNGLVGRREGGKRLYVTAPVPSDLAGRFSAAMVLGEVSFFELWEACAAWSRPSRKARPSASPRPSSKGWRTNLKRTRLALSDNRCLAGLDIELHDLVAAGSRNRALRLCREPIRALISGLLPPALASRRRRAPPLRPSQHPGTPVRAGRRGSARLVNKHVVDFKRGYELARLDLSRPATWPDPSSSP